jgi:hypothetical protein
MPPSTQRWNQSWTVLLGPNLRGSCSHWQPDRMRKMMPLRAARQLATRRPVAFLGQNSLRIGSTLFHNSSGTSQIVPSGLVRGLRRAMARSPVTMPSEAESRYNLLQAKAVPHVLG